MGAIYRATRVALMLCVCVAFALPTLPTIGVRAAGTIYYVGQLFPDDTGTNTIYCTLPNNTSCTLRDALAVATSGMDTIQFTSNASTGVYTLGTGMGQGTLVLAYSVTIQGPGAGQLTIDGGLNAGTGSAGTRVFLVNSGVTATISGVEIAHGNTTEFGGAVANNGALTLMNDLLDHNNATKGGGAVSSDGTNASLTVTGSTFANNTTSNANGNGGGAIEVLAGTASLTDSTVTANNANGSGGGYGGGGILSFGSQLTLTRVQVTNNTTGMVMIANSGGGIFANGPATITDSIITGNSASQAGGGINAVSTLTVSGSTIANNTAGTDSGGIAATGALNVTTSMISGNTAATSGGGITVGSTATISGSTITGNTASRGGGGINAAGRLTLSNSTVENNTAGTDSGGIAATGPLNLTTSTISSNTAVTAGGGITVGSTATITNSTISGNTATSASSGGGGLYLIGTSATLANDTVAGNGAGNAGGGIYNQGGTVSLTNVTVSGNNGVVQFYTSSGQVTLIASLIVNPRAAINCSSLTIPLPITDGGANLQFPGVSCGGIPSADPKLDPTGLKNHGGATQTIALLPSSPAIDTLPANNGNCMGADERLITRPQGNGCDSGAYEYVPVRPTVTGTYRAGNGGQQLRLSGAGFQRGSQVVVDGATLPASAVTNFADDGTSLTVQVPPHAAGVVTLAVTNPGALTSAATANLTYAVPNVQATPIPTATVSSRPQAMATVHPHGAVSGAGMPTPLPQPARH